MYTETRVREELAEVGYNSDDIEIIVKHFPWNHSMDFSGQNCHDVGYDHTDACTGWDGLDRRCDCGNRRVYWVVEGNYAYGEAY